MKIQYDDERERLKYQLARVQQQVGYLESAAHQIGMTRAYYDDLEQELTQLIVTFNSFTHRNRQRFKSDPALLHEMPANVQQSFDKYKSFRLDAPADIHQLHADLNSAYTDAAEYFAVLRDMVQRKKEAAPLQAKTSAQKRNFEQCLKIPVKDAAGLHSYLKELRAAEVARAIFALQQQGVLPEVITVSEIVRAINETIKPRTVQNLFQLDDDGFSALDIEWRERPDKIQIIENEILKYI
ncbi:hypothetical protein MVI27_09800 [Chryseobacterium salipaludis]|uniref:hypothetical protein n=1 Tax=Chryseobacterium TaxID=59732 RepID=UPI001FF486AD|nr:MULTISPECIES: hypothetical protein [Chryseobacterium]MCJ8498554.1 hypothetical protein [Chryseobacterium salipaludis]MCX3297121.1 hypothetical protein [Planobacterium sp. JC490]